jgi:hypothetical protein
VKTVHFDEGDAGLPTACDECRLVTDEWYRLVPDDESERTALCRRFPSAEEDLWALCPYCVLDIGPSLGIMELKSDLVELDLDWDLEDEANLTHREL